MKYYQSVIFAVVVSLASLACQDDEGASMNVNPELDSGIVATDSVLGDILRTPASRFADLPDYNFEPNYLDVGVSGPLYMHYIDEGPVDGPVMLLVHGNPAWSYLVREMVPSLVGAGYRVIAPDLVGFGKSDKPAERSAHTYDHHTEWMIRFVQVLGLEKVTLHVQDWGGLIGLRVAIYEEARFARVAISNSALPDGFIGNEQAFSFWRDNISQTIPNFGVVLDRATPTSLTAEEVAAYDAPYPDDQYTAGPREMPKEVPFDPSDAEAVENQELLKQWATWEKPLMTVFAAVDSARQDLSSTAQGQDQFRLLVPGAEGQPHVLVPQEEAGHYLQEDVPELLAAYLIKFAQEDL